MKDFPGIFFKIGVQILHFLGIPTFVFCFILFYRPFDIDTLLDMGTERYAFNLTMLVCIMFGVMLLSRLLFYTLRDKLRRSWGLYAFWCLMEIVMMTGFMSLYMWLSFPHKVLFFEVVITTFGYTASILFFPYLIFALMLIISAQGRTKGEINENERIRFYDEKQNLKFVVAAGSILYIEAEENYVRIHYTDTDKMKSYLLRNSMKGIEELCQYNGLMRCHRSFYINSSRIKVLRKDKEGIIYIELDNAESKRIPVTKRYYEQLTSML